MKRRRPESNLLNTKQFQDELQQLAIDHEQPLDQLQAEATTCLAEMRGDRNPMAVRGFAWLSRFMYRRGYNPDVIYDTAELERVRRESAGKSVVYLVTHKTYLDFFILFDFLYRQGIAPPFIFGGINMAFAGFGNLARHAGGIFIRRSFRHDLAYKLVLRHYIASLIRAGHSFMWAIEGTRSRTGKLVLPKLGLLKYVVDASQSIGEKAIDYVPVSVAYDQIPDVLDMSRQEAGSAKKPESLSWFIQYVRKTSGHFGNIYLRFGESLTADETTHAPTFGHEIAADGPASDVRKLAFEVCYRINEVTPATSVSLTVMSLLCRGACSAAQIHDDILTLRHYLCARQSSASFSNPSTVIQESGDRTLAMLLDGGIIEVKNSTRENQYRIVPARYLVALYYSNMAAHHFVIPAFVELGLLDLAHGRIEFTGAAMNRTMHRMRDLFKFEFFFARKEQFQQQLAGELIYLGIASASLNTQSCQSALELLTQQPLRVADSVLSPYVHAYQLVADYLLLDAAHATENAAEFVDGCQKLGRQTKTLAQAHIAPRALLMNGHSLAANRGLLEQSPDAARRVNLFRTELDDLRRQLGTIRNMNT